MARMLDRQTIQRRIDRLTPFALSLESRLSAWRRITADLQSLESVRGRIAGADRSSSNVAKSHADRVAALHAHIDGLEHRAATYTANLKAMQEAVTEAERNLRESQNEMVGKIELARQAEYAHFVASTMAAIVKKLEWVSEAERLAGILVARLPGDSDARHLLETISGGAITFDTYQVRPSDVEAKKAEIVAKEAADERDKSAAKTRQHEALYQRAHDAFLAARLNATQLESIKSLIEQYRAEAAQLQIDQAKAIRASESARFSLQQIDAQRDGLQIQLDSLRVTQRDIHRDAQLVNRLRGLRSALAGMEAGQ